MFSIILKNHIIFLIFYYVISFTINNMVYFLKCLIISGIYDIYILKES